MNSCLSCGQTLGMHNLSHGAGICQTCWDKMPVPARIEYQSTLWQNKNLRALNDSLNEIRVAIDSVRAFIETVCDEARAENRDGRLFPWERN